MSERPEPVDRRAFLRLVALGGALSGAALGGVGVGRATHGGDGFQRVTSDYTDMHEVPVPANPDGGVRRLFVDDATGEMSVRTTAGSTVSLEGGTFTLAATIVSPAVNDFVAWRAPADPGAYTLINLFAYQDVGTGSTINAFKGTLASPTLFRASDYAIIAADTWEDAASLQNVSIVTGDAIYFRIASLVGSPTEIGIQLDLTRP